MGRRQPAAGAAERLARTCRHLRPSVSTPLGTRPASSDASSGEGDGVGGGVLTDAQKTELYHDGFTVVRQAVAPELVAAARRRLEGRDVREDGVGQSAEVAALLSESSLRPMLEDLSGVRPFAVKGPRGEWGCYPTIRPAPDTPAPTLTHLQAASCAPPHLAQPPASRIAAL